MADDLHGQRASGRRRGGARARLMLGAAMLFSYGCSEEPSNNPSTHLEFTESVQAICRHYNTKGAAAADHLVRFNEPARDTAKIAEITGQEVDRLRKVRPPETDANGYAEFISGKEGVRAGWLRAAELAQRADNHFIIAVKLDEIRVMSLSAMRIGLNDCAAGLFVRDHQNLENMPADRRAFVERGDAICRAADEPKAELYVRLEDYFPPRSPAKFAEATAQLIEVMRREVGDLRTLVPPSEDRSKITAVLDGYSEVTTSLELAQRTAEKGDADTYYKLWDEARGRIDRNDRVLRRYGFQQCGWLRALTI